MFYQLWESTEFKDLGDFQRHKGLTSSVEAWLRLAWESCWLVSSPGVFTRVHHWLTDFYKRETNTDWLVHSALTACSLRGAALIYGNRFKTDPGSYLLPWLSKHPSFLKFVGIFKFSRYCHLKVCILNLQVFSPNKSISAFIEVGWEMFMERD